MGRNLYEKIIGEHLVSGKMAAGTEVGIKIDQTLTQDALGTMAYLQFESLGVPREKTDSVSYVDHNTLQDGFENADDHRYLQRADKHGIKYRKRQRICHRSTERFSLPFDPIGSDSHTRLRGMACSRWAVGGMDVAALAGGPFTSFPESGPGQSTGAASPMEFRQGRHP
jgi:aconitate hydratase